MKITPVAVAGFMIFASIALTVRPAAAGELTKIIYRAQPPAALPIYNWTGLYGGLNAGGGVATGQFLDPCFTCADIKIQDPFALAGGQIGYQWQWHAMVVGLEGDFDWTGANRSLLYAADDSCCKGLANLDMDAFASIRARMGLAYENALIYVTAGPAFGHFNSSVQLGTFGGFDTDTSTDHGWHSGIAAGAGVEFMLTNNLSLRGEFLAILLRDANSNYLDNGTGLPIVCAAGPCGINYTYSAEIARLGLNWRLWN